jgi:hypothetical protein
VGNWEKERGKSGRAACVCCVGYARALPYGNMSELEGCYRSVTSRVFGYHMVMEEG